MKYILLFLALQLVFPSFAQENLNSRHKLSIGFGVNSSKDLTFSKEFNSDKWIFAPNISLGYYHQFKGINWINIGINYFQVGDIYNYYSGVNRNKEEVKIVVNTLKIPILYTVFFANQKKVNFYTKFGPSFDFILGESVLKPESTDAFRKNISQGQVIKDNFILPNISAGISFKNDTGIKSIIEVSYNGTFKGIFKESTNGFGKSEYVNLSLRLEIFFF